MRTRPAASVPLFQKRKEDPWLPSEGQGRSESQNRLSSRSQQVEEGATVSFGSSRGNKCFAAGLRTVRPGRCEPFWHLNRNLRPPLSVGERGRGKDKRDIPPTLTNTAKREEPTYIESRIRTMRMIKSSSRRFSPTMTFSHQQGHMRATTPRMTFGLVTPTERSRHRESPKRGL